MRQALGVWARIAALSFGGPAGQIAVMHRILVEERRWISETRFLHALNYCMLLPGPEAQQLATYVGWLMHGVRGGFLAGGLFILPGAIAIMALSIVYALFGSVGFVAALFFGLKAAVLAIVIEAVVRVGRRALKNDVTRGLAALAFVALFAFHIPFPLVVLAAGLIGYIGASRGHSAFLSGGGHGGAGADDGRPALLSDAPFEQSSDMRRAAHLAALACAVLWLAPVAIIVATLGGNDVFSQIALFFSKMAVVTFGGAYAVLAYVAQQAVEGFHWLKPGEMLDGLGMAETTPGPLIMVLQFVGFMGAFRDPGALGPLMSGVLGGLLATWVTFAPCFLWIFLGAPYIERLRDNKALSGALGAITAAVVGVILNLAVWFAIHTLFARTVTLGGMELPDVASVNPAALILALGAGAGVFWLKAGMLRVLGASAAAGVVLYLAGFIS
ncbi:MAG: chromate transporter, chromate ion transporter family [Hyphomicrobiales bacterium]|nr:chromate transporter, chromate ion transporter family [Hyphomicrobiales bacterium]